MLNIIVQRALVGEHRGVTMLDIRLCGCVSMTTRVSVRVRSCVCEGGMAINLITNKRELF